MKHLPNAADLSSVTSQASLSPDVIVGSRSSRLKAILSYSSSLIGPAGEAVSLKKVLSQTVTCGSGSAGRTDFPVTRVVFLAR